MSLLLLQPVVVPAGYRWPRLPASRNGVGFGLEGGVRHCLFEESRSDIPAISDDLHDDRACSSGLAPDGHVLRIASEMGDVLMDPR